MISSADAQTASTFRPALVLMGGRIVGFAAVFGIPVLLARLLDQTEFGTYKQLFLVAATLYGVGQLGMAESLYYFLPGRPAAAGRYAANSAWVLLGGGGLALVALIALGEPLSRWLNNPALSAHTPLLGVYLLFMLGSSWLEIVMIARKRIVWASGTYAALDVARAGLMVIPPAIAPGLGGLLWGAVGFAALRGAFSAWYLVREFGAALRTEGTLLRAQLGYAIPFLLAGVLEIAQQTLHQYVVAHRVDAATFAVYSVGCLQIPLVELVTASVLNVMMVRMSEEIREGRPGAAVAVWHDGARKLALLFFPAAAFLVLAAHPIMVLLFTERYAASAPVFMASSLALLLPALAVDAVLRVHAETRALLGLQVVRLGLTALLIGWFIATLGLVGGILVTVLAAAAAKALGLARIARVLGVGFRRVLPWRDLGLILGVAAAAGVPAAAARAALDPSPALAVCVAAAVFGAAYAGGLLALGVLTEDERAAVSLRWARRRIRAMRTQAEGTARCAESRE